MSKLAIEIATPRFSSKNIAKKSNFPDCAALKEGAESRLPAAIAESCFEAIVAGAARGTQLADGSFFIGVRDAGLRTSPETSKNELIAQWC